MQHPPYLLFFIILSTSTLYSQGPINGFMPKPGQLDAAFTYSGETFSEFYNENGDLIPRNIDATSYNLFFEYGLDPKTALIATAPYIENTPDNKGWQDGSIWLKYRNERVEQEKGYHNFITSIGLGFPLSSYPNDNLFAIGRRATTFQGRFLWQYDAKYGWFVSAQSGIDFQFAPEALAALPILVRGGIGTSRFYADVWLEHYQSLQGASDNQNSASGAGSTWTRAGGTFYVPVAPWVGVFTGGAIILGGKNIGQSTRWNLGAVFRVNS
ncbi:hypothetical protein [Lewinella cohaerens]|uniref:hypothetical protein n=1 Tax=Lewinella cohaerens TaxID=70995 RepID=UPI00036C4135|nr:hypothetical protein [Lewinella cohaerens]